MFDYLSIKFSHTIKQINTEFKDLYFKATDNVREEVLQMKSLPASRIACIKYTNGTEQISAYIKQLPSRNHEEYLKHHQLIQKEYGLLKEYFKIFTDNDKIKIIEPLACFPDMLAHITRAEEGVSLDAVIRANLYSSLIIKVKFNFLQNTCRTIGEWLYEVEKIKKESIKVDDFINDLSRNIILKLKHLSEDNIIHSELIDKIQICIDQVAPDLYKKEIKISLFHGDFLPGNIFIQGEKIMILDFSDGGIGTIYKDLAYLIEWLEFLKFKLFIFKKKISQLQEIILEKFITDDSFNALFYRFISLKVAVNSLHNHAHIMKHTSKKELINRFFNHLKYRYILSRINSICQKLKSLSNAH